MQTTTATPSRQRKPRAKPARTIRLTVPPTPEESGVVVITVGKLTTPYFIDKIPSDFGEAFSLQKFDGEGYDVNLSPEGSTCEYKGFLKWGHCKHIEGVEALRNAGRL